MNCHKKLHKNKNAKLVSQKKPNYKQLTFLHLAERKGLFYEHQKGYVIQMLLCFALYHFSLLD
ncbi:MAG: hypothetical protein EBQ94_05350 [Flavobacteriales bacterium]|nr:hypothetical protein [Crocinitomicaceae bacterium]NBX79796.1 hypothetical protein [Flavobacteriales bacterium]NCA21792.1 hypothetical protein [Crocinitomicaceae bacterium]